MADDNRRRKSNNLKKILMMTFLQLFTFKYSIFLNFKLVIGTKVNCTKLST